MNKTKRRIFTTAVTLFAEKGYESILVTSFIDKWEYRYNSNVKRMSL